MEWWSLYEEWVVAKVTIADKKLLLWTDSGGFDFKK